MTTEEALTKFYPGCGSWLPLRHWCQQSDVPTPFWVSSEGRVASDRNNVVRLFEGNRLSSGYLQVTLSMNGRRWLVLVHRLVALTHLGASIEQLRTLEVDHLDRNPSNNAATNLQLKSRSENSRNRSRFLSVPITESACERIAGMLLEGRPEAEVVRMARVSPGTIRRIKNGNIGRGENCRRVQEMKRSGEFEKRRGGAYRV